MLTTVKLGPQDHGRLVRDDDLPDAEFLAGYDYEIIFGRLYVSPAPDFEHDWIEKHVFGQVYLYSREHPDIVAYVTDRARVFVPGSQQTTAPEPDLAIYSQVPASDWRDVSPMIVAEVLRGQDVDKDLFRNVDLYWRVPSIQEYWVFDIRHDPKRPTLLVQRRTESCWSDFECGPDGVYETPLLPAFKLKISPPS